MEIAVLPGINLSGEQAARRMRGPRTMFFGDSIVLGQTTVANGQHKAFSFATMSWLISNGRLRFMRHGNAGVSGDDFGEMLARIETDVLAYSPDVCVVFGGANDALSGRTIGESMADLSAIVDALEAADIFAVLCLVPLTETKTAEIAAINNGIRDLAARRHLPLCDLYAAVMSGGTWISGYSYDQTHPYRYGAGAMAEKLIADLARQGCLWTKSPYLTTAKADPLNLLSNGTFEGDANSDGGADSWTATAAAGRTYALTADPAIVGNWQSVEVTSSSVLLLLNQSVSASGKFQAGDRLALSGLIKTEHIGTPGDGSTYIRPNLYLEQSGGSSSEGVGTVYAVDQLGWPIPEARQFYMETIVPANTTSINVRLTSSNTGTGKIWLAQMTLVNLTAHPELAA